MKEKKSLEEQKAETARKKHEDSVKYLYFSRYMMIRYIAAGLLFTNLFWLVFTLPYHAVPGTVLALAMTIYTVVVSIEQLSKMHNRKRDIPITRYYLYVQMAVNAFLIVILYTPLVRSFFPFVTVRDSRWFVLFVLLLGIVLCIICEIRIRNIVLGKDKYKKVIQTFEKNQQ